MSAVPAPAPAHSRPGKFASNPRQQCQTVHALRMNGYSREGFREEGVSVMDMEGRGLGASTWLEARTLSRGHSRRQEEEEEEYGLFCSLASSLCPAHI